MNENENTAISKSLQDNLSIIRAELGIGISFDAIAREIKLGDRDAAIIFIDGFVKDDMMLQIMKAIWAAAEKAPAGITIEELIRRSIPYIEINTVPTLKELIDEVLAGPAALLVDGEDRAIMIDARTYTVRSPDEPDLERVIRGSRDGLVETIVFNTALVRRRVRDPGLRTELLKVGRRSKTDVVVMYIKDIANPELVELVRKRLKEIDVDGIPMAEKTVEEFIAKEKLWWNPFPTVRYTERPDVAAIQLMEGHVLVIVDTSPSIIILPSTFWLHMQHAEELREDVAVGAYIRLLRLFGVFFSWLGPPLWVALALQREILPQWLSFIGPKEIGRIPIFLQFILAEIGVDMIRIALIHTPNALASSLGFIGAILFGEMAVRVGLFANETVMYTTLAALGTFGTPSIEMGMAVRLMRYVLLILAGLARVPGVLAGFVLNIIWLGRMKSFGIPYLWPLVPFNGKALWTTLVRHPIPTMDRRLPILKPIDKDRLPEPRQ